MEFLLWRFRPSNTFRFSHDPKTRGLGGLILDANWTNGWDEDITKRFFDDCPRPAKECMVGLFGDGARLFSVELD